MGAMHVAPGRHLHQQSLDLVGRRAWRKAGSVGDTEDMGVDGDRRLVQASARTTLAVLRPTPGRASSASRAAERRRHGAR